MNKELTKREREIGYCLIEGLNREQISIKFQISPRTVKAHETKIKRKLGCSNSYQAGHKLGLYLIK